MTPGLLLLPFAVGFCCCLLLLPFAVAFCCCLLLLPFAVAFCCCLLLLPFACCLLPVAFCLLPFACCCCPCPCPCRCRCRCPFGCHSAAKRRNLLLSLSLPLSFPSPPGKVHFSKRTLMPKDNHLAISWPPSLHKSTPQNDQSRANRGPHHSRLLHLDHVQPPEMHTLD
jgi:hypothetical protein